MREGGKEGEEEVESVCGDTFNDAGSSFPSLYPLFARFLIIPMNRRINMSLYHFVLLAEICQHLPHFHYDRMDILTHGGSCMIYRKVV